MLIVGNPSLFAIESSMTEVYEDLGKIALGYFVVHVNGKRYGVHTPDATLLAVALQGVRRHIARRGTHRSELGSEPSAVVIALAARVAYSGIGDENARFCGMSPRELGKELGRNKVYWAPGCDEAFDDNSYIVQFDVEDRVRVVAFVADEDDELQAATVSEAWLSADEFYGILNDWQAQFEGEWKARRERITLS